MNQIDINQQWRELQENYSAMSDEEIEGVAQEAYDLTDFARQVLQTEISRRQLKIEMRLQAPESEEEVEPPPKGYPTGFNPEDWGLIDLTPVENLEQAREIKKCFDDAGIPSYYGPDLVDDLRLLPSPLPGPLQIQVRETDQSRAIAVLNRCPQPAAEEEETKISDFVGHCPKCHSTDIVLESFEEASEQSAAPKYNWSCDACGHHWTDDGNESEI